MHSDERITDLNGGVVGKNAVLAVKQLLGEERFEQLRHQINKPQAARDATRDQQIDNELRAVARKEVEEIVTSEATKEIIPILHDIDKKSGGLRYKIKNFTLENPQIDPATRYVFHRLREGAGIDEIASEFKKTHSFVRYRIKRLALLFAVAGITVPEFLAPRSPRFTPYERALYTEAVLAAERILQKAREDRLRDNAVDLK